MKGHIVIALQNLVKKQFGEENWTSILEKTKLPKNQTFFGHHDVEDNLVMSLIQNTCEVLNITIEQASESFGKYWMTEYAPEKYFAFFSSSKTAKDFLLNMDRVHTKITEKMENAAPPSFTYEEIDNNTITMTYSSPRDLVPIWIGLIKGVGIYFKEDIKIRELEKNKVELTFN